MVAAAASIGLTLGLGLINGVPVSILGIASIIVTIATSAMLHLI